MARFPSSWLARLARRRTGNKARDPAEAPAAPSPPEPQGRAKAPGKSPSRPDGTLVWIADSATGAALTVADIADTACDMRDDLTVLFSTATGSRNTGAADLLQIVRPRDTATEARGFLDRWRPDAAVFFASALPRAALTETLRRGIPVLLIADTAPPRAVRAQLRHLTGAVCIGATAAEALRSAGLPELRLDVCVRLTDEHPAPGCDDTERENLARILAGRPIWLAAGTTASEDAVVVEAQTRASRLAHRLLLILMPDDPQRGPLIAGELRRQGWRVTLRSAGEIPDEETQIHVADTRGERGLWLRLAPVTYLGGSLDSKATGGFNPSDPAALGSAILHGPNFGAHAVRLRRLVAAHATRPVGNAGELAHALNTLSAPDRVAELAHNAWLVSSEGAETTRRIVQRILAAVGPAEGD